MIYRNANIRHYQSLDRIQDQSDSRDVLLTPHILDPTDGGFAPPELDLLRRGTHNLALSRSGPFATLRGSCVGGRTGSWTTATQTSNGDFVRISTGWISCRPC